LLQFKKNYKPRIYRRIISISQAQSINLSNLNQVNNLAKDMRDFFLTISKKLQT